MEVKNYRRCGDAIFYWNDKKYGNIMEKKNVVYMLKTADNREYIGNTNKMGKRLIKHLCQTNTPREVSPYVNGLSVTKSVEVSILDIVDDDKARREREHELIVLRIQEIIKEKTNLDIPEFAIHNYKPLWNDILLNRVT